MSEATRDHTQPLVNKSEFDTLAEAASVVARLADEARRDGERGVPGAAESGEHMEDMVTKLQVLTMMLAFHNMIAEDAGE